MALSFRGELARAGGWLARARRLLDEIDHDCVEQGYLLVPLALQAIAEQDYPRVIAIFSQAVAIGERFGDLDLVTMARHGQGRALIRSGSAAEGLALLDEVMVAVTTDELSPTMAGIVYCSVIDACHEIFDVRRSREWTAALDRWSSSQQGRSPFRGACLVHRAEIMRLQGSWAEALDEGQLACDQLSQPPPHPAVGGAFYHQAELYRLRGDFPQAEAAYLKASELGHLPQPGLALLRLEQGRVEDAEKAIRGALDSEKDSLTRSRLLPGYIEIMIAAHDLPAARAAAEELSEVAGSVGAPFLQAASAQAWGAINLADGDALAALGDLRQSVKLWQGLDAPYEVARAVVLVGLARRELGDEDTAKMELGTARRILGELGAAPALRRLEQLAGGQASPAGGLTGREVEVLALVATGKTNRQIAAELVISEKTVARHLSNIFTKLGVASRAAATAYAYDHHLN